MKQRAITSVFIVLAVGLAIASTLLLKEIFDVFMSLIAIISAVEVSNILLKQDKKHNRFLACMYVPILYVPFVFAINTSFNLPMLFVWMIVAFISWTILSFIYEFGKKAKLHEDNKFKNATISVKNTAFIGLYPCLFVSMFFIINHLDGFVNITNKYLSLWMIVLIWAITMLSDTFAYLVGRTFKGPKVCPKVSPNKTWSGCIGGLIGGIAGALAVWGILHVNAFASILSILNINVWIFIAIGLIGSAISQAGDFYESFLKRKAGVKDSGKLFPGHGGMLDRIDALMFNTMFIALFLIFIL